jgi:hypothetical protein
VVADGKVFVVGEEGLVGAEELAYAGGVMDGGVEVGVVGDVDGFDEGGSGYGVEGGFGLVAVRGGGMEEGGEDLAELGPSFWTEGHEDVQSWGPAGGVEGAREEVGFGAGVQVEEMDAYGYAEVLLAFELEGSVGEVGKGEVGGRIVGGGEPALMGGNNSRGHAA